MHSSNDLQGEVGRNDPLGEVGRDDLLGEVGRKAAEACVKVATFGKPKLQRYTRRSALNKLWDCYCGTFPNKANGPDLDSVILPERDLDGRQKEFYDINDIYNALKSFDKMEFVKIHVYTDEKENKTADKHWFDVMDEYLNSPGETTYSPEVAQRRVRDCYAGNFPGDVLTLASKEEVGQEDDGPYSIFDIHDALVRNDKKVLKYPREEPTQAGSYTSALTKSIDQQRNSLEGEYKEAVKTFPGKYSAEQAEQRVEDCYKCFKEAEALKEALSEKLPQNSMNQRQYSIIDIRNFCVHCDDSFSADTDTTRKSSGGRKGVDLEYQKAISSCGGQRYSSDKAERLVRNCYVGSFSKDEAILPIKGNPRKTRYSISDIVEALDYYDQKMLMDRYPPAREILEMAKIDECRDAIEKEHKKGQERKEIDNGSGFIIQSHFIITCAHVSLTSDPDEKLCIYNQSIVGQPLCDVVYPEPNDSEPNNSEPNDSEPNKCIDLALLHCKELNIENIQPLQLSDKNLLQGMSIFSFGYPFFHTGVKALLATGFVSGTDDGQGKIKPLMLLNCPVNNGNSGGPLLHFVNNEVKVAGVVNQKHIKEILEDEEINTIDKIEESLQTSSITDLKKLKGAEIVREKGEKPDPCQTPLNLLTLKLYRALKTHCQFVSSKAISRETLCEFLSNAANSYKGEHKEELEQFRTM